MTFYDAVKKMQEMNVNADYQNGWCNGYWGHSEREEQRLNDDYSAGYEDGQEKNADNFGEHAA